MPCRKAQGDAGGAPDVEVHPAFPSVPGSVPLTFALTMQACLAPSPTDRPSFEQVLTLLHDCASEVAVGEYINAAGLIQVCPSSTPVYLELITLYEMVSLVRVWDVRTV